VIDRSGTAICSQCRSERPIKSFRLHGKKLVGGIVRKYRDSICRRCQRKTKKLAGLCVCGQTAEASKTSCRRCLDLAAKSSRNLRRRNRLIALKHYGIGCAYCGENLEAFLTIDHINNDGAKHRKELVGKSCGGVDIGSWLRKNSYPKGFQVLCVNCNHAKGRIGTKKLVKLLRERGRLRPDFRYQK